MDSGNHLLGWRSVACNGVCHAIVHLQCSSAGKLAQTSVFIPVREQLRRKHDAVHCMQNIFQILQLPYITVWSVPNMFSVNIRIRLWRGKFCFFLGVW